MTRNKDDHYYAEKLLKEVNRLLSFAKRLDLSDPESNEEAFYAANFCVVRIREILTSLSKDFVINRLGVNLDAFIDFRNLLVHGYGKTDYSSYEDFITEDIANLKRRLEDYLSY
jgi:uncharacterized protein with HEPN domain